jgi:heme/copper-type cytochrome/quinol oxidase subunit 3
VSAVGAIRVSATPRPGRAISWWGMAMVIATEAMVFAVLLAAWFYLRATSKAWPPAGTELPELRLTVPFSLVLWGSSIPVLLGERAIRHGRLAAFRWWMAAAWLLGAAFLAYTAKDFADLHYGWRDSAYASGFYVIVGLHAVHVVIGLGMSAVVQAKAWLGRYDHGPRTSAEAVALYWHFVDAVWLAVMPSVFLATHLR